MRLCKRFPLPCSPHSWRPRTCVCFLDLFSSEDSETPAIKKKSLCQSYLLHKYSNIYSNRDVHASSKPVQSILSTWYEDWAPTVTRPVPPSIDAPSTLLSAVTLSKLTTPLPTMSVKPQKLDFARISEATSSRYPAKYKLDSCGHLTYQTYLLLLVHILSMYMMFPPHLQVKSHFPLLLLSPANKITWQCQYALTFAEYV